jgi:hypothetical protein
MNKNIVHFKINYKSLFNQNKKHKIEFLQIIKQSQEFKNF